MLSYPFGHCLSFDIGLLITTLMSSKFSWHLSFFFWPLYCLFFDLSCLVTTPLLYLQVFLPIILTVCIICFVLSYYVSLRFEFRVVMSVTNSAWKLCSVRLYPLFLGELMSFLRYFCCLRIVVSSAYCVVFLFCLSSFTLPVSLVVHFDCPFIIL
jgi:hypothetical protein